MEDPKKGCQQVPNSGMDLKSCLDLYRGQNHLYWSFSVRFLVKIEGLLSKLLVEDYFHKRRGRNRVKMTDMRIDRLKGLIRVIVISMVVYF